MLLTAPTKTRQPALKKTSINSLHNDESRLSLHHLAYNPDVANGTHHATRPSPTTDPTTHSLNSYHLTYYSDVTNSTHHVTSPSPTTDPTTHSPHNESRLNLHHLKYYPDVANGTHHVTSPSPTTDPSYCVRKMETGKKIETSVPYTTFYVTGLHT